MKKAFIFAVALIASASAFGQQRYFVSNNWWDIISRSGSSQLYCQRHSFVFDRSEVAVTGPGISKKFPVVKVKERPDAAEYTVKISDLDQGLIVARLDSNSRVTAVTMYLLGVAARQCNK